MRIRHSFAGLMGFLVLANACSSGKTEAWQALANTGDEPVSVGLHTIRRDGDIATMQTQILFSVDSPSNKLRHAAGKPLLSHVKAKYRYDCKLHTAELLSAIEYFSASGNETAPEAVETAYPPNATPVKPDSSAKDALNIACRPG